jgi:hypothetical protein
MHGRNIAGEQQMIAVIDAATELRIEIGAGAAACRLGRLMQHHALAKLGQPAGRRQPGQAGSNDVNRVTLGHGR